MKLTPAQKNLLTIIAQAPRRADYFTNGKDVESTTTRNNSTKARLAAMVEAGLLYEAESAFHITKLGRSKLDLGNVASTKEAKRSYEPYKVGMGDSFHQPQRPGSNHSALKSKGFLC
jgi:Cu/Zn superoxide dismutase